MTDAHLIAVELIERKIYRLHGQKVMLDRDLAELYGVDTRTLNQAVRRNIERFPDDFMITLTREEIRNISQIVICSKMKHAKNVYAFTEQGVAMLSGVLKSNRAVQVNIAIMRAFVRLRETLSTSRELAKKMQELETHIAGHDKSIEVLFESIRALMNEPEKPKRTIGFTAKEKRATYGVKKLIDESW
jgi:hypothetical protein